MSEIFYNIRKDEFNWCNNENILIDDFYNVTKGEVIFFAMINNKVIGFASVWEEDKFIHNLFVHKEYRNLGVGKALIERVDNYFERPITLKCVANNNKALEFYKYSGWKIKEQGNSEDGIYYLMALE